MSNTKLLACLMLTFLPFGYSLKCFSYYCSKSSVSSPTCAAPREVTCVRNPLFPSIMPDRCDTKRLSMEMSGITILQEIRNCSYSVQCNMVDLFCKSANVSGAVKKCEMGCCQGDLCNSGGPIPTQAPQPTGPSGGDLSCYSCSDYPLNGNVVSCQNPVKQTCGASPSTRLPQDRCLTLKVKANVPHVGTIEQTMKNCSELFYCDKNTICGIVNRSGIISDCQPTCCLGNLCNSDIKTSQPPSSTNVTGSPAPIGTSGNPGGTVPSGVASTKTKVPAALICLSALFVNLVLYNFDG